MQVDLFREFITLAEELNFHSAARRLNLTQSTLSKHIAVLEREYGTSLFNRDRFGVALTGGGAALLESARIIAEEYERSCELMATTTSRSTLLVAGELDNPSCVEIVSRTLGLFANAQPSCKPSFVPFTTAALDAHVAALLSAEADVTVLKLDRRALSARPDVSRFECRLVSTLPVFALMSQRNPLANEGCLRLSDLTGCTLIRLVGPRFSPSWRLIERQLHRASLPFTTTPVAVNSTLDCINLDLRSSVLLMPHLTFDESTQEASHVVAVPVDPAELNVSLYALSLKGPRSGLVNDFVDALAQTYEEKVPR